MDLFKRTLIYLDKDHFFESSEPGPPYWKPAFYGGTHFLFGSAYEHHNKKGKSGICNVMIPLHAIKFAI